MKMNKKYIQYFAFLIIIVAGHYSLFNCSKVILPKNSKVISYVIWDKETPELFDLTLDYSFQKNLSVSNITLYEIEKGNSPNFEKSLTEFSECAFGLIPRNRGDFSLNDAPLVVMLVENPIDHSRYTFLIGLQNLESKVVFIRRTKIHSKGVNYVEYENEGCYQDKNGYQGYIQLIQGDKALKRNISLFEIFKEYQDLENIHSDKYPDLHWRLLFISFAFFGGVGSMLILLMLPDRTRNIPRKKKLIIAIAYGTFCLIISASLLL
ncbi:hypothetical protein [Leptospira sanjuanensis]|uniref:hypothetical protein n=2 Tax=Leptospira sanjuanensis TaxID=2879643 RepID=UPI001EE97569|nr:hypothetical protein [Leptospira sanjuanensis]MCG6166821.1 hypothetical protein [Leptospira sanjuanensis]